MLSILRNLLSGDGFGLEDMIHIFVLLFVVICCTPVHESAHAWMAERLGDSTGRLKGRISLNPLVHIDIIGAVLILLFGFGYAKPVPVNIRNFPVQKRKLYFALVALAGPVSNLSMALVFSLLQSVMHFVLIRGFSAATVVQVAFYFFSYACYINIALAVFNLIPVPPLDGSRLITAVLPDRLYYKLMSLERYSMWIIFLALFIFNRIGFSPLSILTTWVYNAFSFLTGLPFGLN